MQREDYAVRLKELVNRMVTSEVTVEFDSDLVEDIGLSSVEIMELVEQLEDAYDVSFPLNDLADVRTLRDLAAHLEQLVTKR